MAEKRLAVVTGAARGIGRVVVLELLKQDRIVAGVDVNAEQLAEMEKVVIQNVVTDRCPSCHGMWLDEGELEIVSRVLATDPNLTSLPGLSGDLARAFLEGGQTTP